MEYITAQSKMANAIHHILHTTIRTVYPKYYPKEVVDFFCSHHSREHVLEGIASGNMGVLLDRDTIVGTGCYDGNHITGVYVLPDHRIKAAVQRLWIIWRRRSQRATIRYFWMLRFPQSACMSTGDIGR